MGQSVDLLTDSTPCHRLCRKREDGKDLGHDLPKQLRKFIREWDPSITLQTLKEEVNTLKKMEERNTPSCL